jgi:transposase
MFSYVDIEERIPANHPLRKVKIVVDGILRSMSDEFQRRYSRMGRPSIPPERLLRALLLQVLYTIRSERQLMEQLDYNLLFRWFVGLGMGLGAHGTPLTRTLPRRGILCRRGVYDKASKIQPGVQA